MIDSSYGQEKNSAPHINFQIKENFLAERTPGGEGGAGARLKSAKHRILYSYISHVIFKLRTFYFVVRYPNFQVNVILFSFGFVLFIFLAGLDRRQKFSILENDD